MTDSLFSLLTLGQLSVEEEPMRDIVGPVSIPNYWLWAALAAGVILLVLLILKLLNRKKRLREKRMEMAAYVSPFEEAMQGLASVRPMMEEGDDEAFSVSVSRVIRRYIERQFSVKAEEMTTDEFLPVAASDPRLQGRKAGLLADFLQYVDLVKFAKQSLGAEKMRELYGSAENFINETEGSGLEEAAKGERV